MRFLWSNIWFVKTFPFTLGHINVSPQNGFKSDLQFRTICKFNGVHVKERNRYALPISCFQIKDCNRRAWHQHWKDKLVLLLLRKMFVYWASATYFEFYLRQLAEEIVYSATHLRDAGALALYLTITILTIVISDYIANNTLSHVYYYILFNILGGVSGFNIQMRLHLSSLSGMRPRPPPEAVWAIGFKSVSKVFWRVFTPGGYSRQQVMWHTRAKYV